MPAPPDSKVGRLSGRHPGATLVAAGLLWAGGGLIGRGAPMSGAMLAFWRSLLAAAGYQLVLARRGRRLRLADLRTAALGGAGFGASVAGLFIAYKSTTLVSANVIACLQPLALGALDHRRGRRIPRRLWLATVAAVGGTILVVIGSSAHTGTWSLRGDLFAAGGTAANMVYVLGTKRARRTMGPLEYQASALWTAAAVTLPVALWSATGRIVPVTRGWFWVLGLIAIGGSGHLLFAAAQRHVSVAASSAILLVEVLGVAAGGALLYHQSIGVLQGVGMGVVAVAVAVWLAHAPPGAPVGP